MEKNVIEDIEDLQEHMKNMCDTTMAGCGATILATVAQLKKRKDSVEMWEYALTIIGNTMASKDPESATEMYQHLIKISDGF